ncbi:hypothetical protein P3T27_004574 [Kitasatospora sp. MAA19]|uniref:hypothetical protein n=1 Tax=Kitasatospora sp. MAA19 TaxID=3035090 RepID=UPI0024746EE0|nr:hypothetical protein [Kitasatospora sp. MAA19]MDH6707837.1 hypothetical protein [Kitasatospora sp. MAA19]
MARKRKRGAESADKPCFWCEREGHAACGKDVHARQRTEDWALYRQLEGAIGA